MKNIAMWDTTLRDGAQANGIAFSVKDKVNIAKALDNFGISYIEGGNPCSNPKDVEFFETMKSVHLVNSKLVAFGSTRRKACKVEDDSSVQALIDAGTDNVVIFGKSWDFHATEILEVSLDENLCMIKDTIGYLRDNGKTVFFDAEHFFDGYNSNPDYALTTLQTAIDAGAVGVCLCDTNGNTFPDEIFSITQMVKERINVLLILLFVV